MDQLKRSIGLNGLTLVVIGSCVGSGIFLTPSIVTSYLQSPIIVLIAWAVGGLIAVSGAITFAELSSTIPDAGGLYTHLRKAYGDWAGFLYGWSYLVVVVSGAIAALCIACANYAAYIFDLNDVEQIILAICAVVFISVVNILGVKFGELFSSVFTTAKLLGILVIVALGFFVGKITFSEVFVHHDVLHRSSVGLSNWTVFGAALIGVVFSYGGFQHASFLSAETKDPQRNVALAMIIGTCIVTFIYLLTNVAYFRSLPVEEISGSTALAADAVGESWSRAGSFVAILIAISTFGTAGIYTLSAPRMYHAMAADGLFWKGLTAIHKNYGTPFRAIIVQGAWAIALIVFWQTFADLITYIVFVDWIFLTMAAYSIFIFRKRISSDQRAYNAFAFPITPWIFIVISVYIIISTIINQPLHALTGLVFLALGLVIFKAFNRSK